MSATQELSQWAREQNVEAAPNDDALNYTPGHPGYVDLELGITQPATQAEITPNVETRLDRYPEGKRFIEPETPVTGRKIDQARNNNSSNDFQTPQLPLNPFVNPFGPPPGEDNGEMGLTQVFKATQAGSSPNLLRRLQPPSSQRPSPNILTRSVFEIPSDIVSDRSSGGLDLQEIPDALEASSPTDSIVTSSSVGSRNADNHTHKNKSPQEYREPHIESGKVGRKSRRRSSAQVSTSHAVTGTDGARNLRSIRRGNTQERVESAVVEGEGNTSEEETELEDEDDSAMHLHEDNSECNKENRTTQYNRSPRPGLHIKRATQSAPKQGIPFSSSPVLARPQPLAKGIEDQNIVIQGQSSSIREKVDADKVNEDRQITIADSQSSQKPTVTQSLRNHRQLAGSSNDSRKIVPQSQAAKPQSSLQITSTAPKLTNMESQQTVSPPDSSSGGCNSGDHNVIQGQGPQMEISETFKPVSPRSSPPLQSRGQEHDQVTCPDAAAAAATRVDDIEDDEISVDVFAGTGSARRQSETVIRGTPYIRNTRLASTIPETALHNRHGGEFQAGEGGIEFSFQGLSQNGETEAVQNRPLTASFGSRRSDATVNGHVQISPAKPRTFLALGVDHSQSQEHDSIDLAVFNTQDREIYDTISRHTGTSSSPLAAGRKRRRGNNRQPILLDEVSSDDPTRQGEIQSPTHGKDQRQQFVTSKALREKPLDQDDSATDTAKSKIKEHDEDTEEERIPFLERPTHTHTYGKRLKELRKSRVLPSTAPVTCNDQMETVARKRGRPRKTSVASFSASDMSKQRAHTGKVSLSRGAVDPRSSSVRQSSAKMTPYTNYATPRPQQLTSLGPKDLEPVTDTEAPLVPRRIFAKFRGSSPGFFAATCLDRFENDLEEKYSVRFDDGTEDQLGQNFVKRLEFYIGDEVKVDRRQLKASTFVVQGFGNKIDAGELSEEGYPITDIHGHETIKLVEKPASVPKKSKPPQALEFPVTEIFFTIGMWSGVKNRDYRYHGIKPGSTGTPTVTRTVSNFNSPQSRTRSNNKINISGLPAMSFNAQAAKIAAPIIASSGLFKSIAFVVTGVKPAERDGLVKTIARHGGIVIEGFQELFELPKPRFLGRENGSENEGNGPKKTRGPSLRVAEDLQLQLGYRNIRLAVLISERANRSTKYFQALALGIPCLSLQWIKHCLQAGKLKNWRPYMLAAGDSTILLPGNSSVSCSQQLNLTHQEIGDPNLSLATILDRRSMWLQNARVLIVGNGGSGSTSRLQIHSFIASFLGASEVVIAEHAQQAEQHFAREKGSLDWICHDNEVSRENSTNRGERRVKRSRDGARASFQGLKGIEQIKEISVQLVLESLIVGSLLSQEDVREQREQ